MRTLRNKIMVYEGGGYSGCMWEPNTGVFDWNGVFHSCYASGRNGIETEFKRDANNTDEQDVNLACRNAAIQQKAIATAKEIMLGKKDCAILSVNSCKDMKMFNKDYLPGLVAHTVEMVQELYGKAPKSVAKLFKAHVTCDICGCEIVPEIDYIHFVSFREQGGIVITATSKVCNECFDEGSCRMCQEGGNDDDHCYCGAEHLDKHGLCWYHKNYVILEHLENGLVRNIGKGREILSLQKAIELGNKQFQILATLKHPAAKWEAHRNGIVKIQNEIIDIWTELSESERDNIITDENRRCQANTYDAIVQTLLPL